jgi:signal transduction histidine kinase
MALNALTHDRLYIRLQPLVILVFFAGTILTITTHRIFDARQVILVAIEKALLVTLVAAAAFAVEWALTPVFPRPLDLLATIGAVLWFAWVLNSWLDRLFRFYPEATAARQAVFSAAQRETRLENLNSAFCVVLRGWGQSDHAVIVCGTRNVLSGGGIELTDDNAVVRTIRELRWATPERLARERPTPERIELSNFLTTHRLGVLVVAEGPALTALVGVGVAASRRPFTYPQVTQLMELASIMESALERAHFSAKVQHAEQLATVGLLGASLAHEIRNPLVTIKTFVQLLPKHHQDPVFREKFFHLIGDEVGRIDQLTEQLLDLATPRTYEAKLIELHTVLRASLDLVVTKASAKNVRFMTDFQASPDSAFTDASAAKQVMLNLCFNAIQAVEARSRDDRWVKIGTRNTATGIEMVVSDSGLGIAPEIRPRLFQPFQTTKSTGFGLGLAICSDILANLNASISVDPPAPGVGATFRVTFPCQPLLS